MATADDKLRLARKHLLKVQDAWDPPDWADLSMYGLYSLEAAVDAAAMKLGVSIQAQHWARVQAARELTSKHGLPDIADFLGELNAVRKSEAYGDVDAPDLDAEETAARVEEYLEAVDLLLSATGES